MHFTTVTACLTLLGCAIAAPVADPEPIALPAPASVQQQIVTLENQIVYLANDFVQSNAAGAKTDYAAGDSQFQALGKVVLTAGYVCPPSTGMGTITDKNTALEALQSSQENVQDLSLRLQNPAARPKKLNADFCSAYSNFKLTQNYATTYISDSVSALSLAVQAVPVFDLTKYESTYLASQVALEALIAALNTAGADAKTAMRNAQKAIANYETAAVLKDGECPQVKIAAPENAKEAIKQVQGIEVDVQKAFADKKEKNGPSSPRTPFGDFCRIGSFLVSVNSFVLA